MLAALLVLVTGIGGPPGFHRPPNSAMPGSLIEVTQSQSGLVATSRFGSVDWLLPRGEYTVVARVGPGMPPCAGVTKHVRLGRRPTHLHFFCPLK
jgi:hypothetical protein